MDVAEAAAAERLGSSAAHRALTDHGEGWHEFVAADCKGGMHLFPGAPFEVNFGGAFFVFIEALVHFVSVS